MAFPLPTTLPQQSNIGWSTQPTTLRALRKALIDVLFNESPIGDGNDPNTITARQLDKIAQTLSRTASNEPTAYENGSSNTSATTVQSTLTRQVERALTQVLGRSPGRGSDSFVKALNSAFPVVTNGKIAITPSRSIVSNGSSDSPSSTNGTLTGQLSVEQANLYRQASILVADALRVLEGFESFDPVADVDAVEALRSLVQAQLNSLVEEFGRLDEPRSARVNVYFSTLERSLNQLGDAAQLGDQNKQRSFNNLVTIEDEAQVAAYELVKNYVKTLKDIWLSFTLVSDAEIISTGYSERLSRVGVMLPVISDSNASLMAAMDSVGFTESERRSDAALFSTLGTNSPRLRIPDSVLSEFQINPTQIAVTLPDITVNDFSEWVERFTSIEAPSILAASGRFGLDFVTDQADTLFWVIAIVLDYLKNPANQVKGRYLSRILAFDRVEQSLSELVFQLNALADLSVPDSSRFI